MKNEMPDSKEFAKYNTEYDYLQSASIQDCTGLIPMMPANEFERESYEAIYPLLPRVPAKNDIDYVED